VLLLVRAFVDIALHRRGPEDLPASTLLLALAIGADVIVSLGALALAGELETRSAALLGAGLAIYAAFAWAVLKAFNREKRIIETATALFGTDALLTTLQLPMSAWSRSLVAANADATVPNVLGLLLFFWWIDVSGFVLSRAIGRTYVLGVLIMVGYALFSISLQSALLPATTS
jgi:hypothetical protein